MLNLNSLMIGSSNPKKLAEFYKKVLQRKPDMGEEGWYGWQVGSVWLGIGEHSKVQGKSVNPERVIFNFETREVKVEFERLKNLGVEVVTEPYDMGGMDIATLADPDGNYFQLMSPWEGEKK